MRKAAKQVFVCALALVVFCVVCRFFFFDRFSLYIPIYDLSSGSGRPQEQHFTVEDPAILRIGEPEYHDRYVRLPVFPEARGRTDILCSDTNSEVFSLRPLFVDQFFTVFDLSNGNFTGDTAVMTAVTLFWLLVSAVMLWHFFQAKGPAFYDYGTIYYAGFSLFALASGLVMLSVTISHLSYPDTYSMLYAYSAISRASIRFMTLTAPLMLLFAFAMAISNVALLRHEKPMIRNGLGLLVSVLLIIGEILGIYLFTRDFMGSEWEVRINNTLLNTYATVFIYFQCMLTGAVICGFRAARHLPAPDKDYIIILGCWIRPDGTLPPLLRGRADKALEFWLRQKKETGKTAVFIPSGGQGSNEPMSEAEAIRQYLLSRGMEDRLILPENQSVNTYQNMAFSEKIIRTAGSGRKAVFATSSYHVFRSGLWARQAGFPIEGIGSPTKWWFWPNAFMRETAGLLKKRWKQEILFLILLIVFFGFLSMIL